MTEKTPQVFLSFAQEDKRIAQQIAEALRISGAHVLYDAWELAPGVSRRIRQPPASYDRLAQSRLKHGFVERKERRRLQYNCGTEQTSWTYQDRHPAGKNAVPRG
jgi:hypothetical protein